MATVRESEPLSAPAADPDLRVRLEHPVPSTLPVGQATAIFCYGHCFHRSRTITKLELLVAGTRHRPTASGMARRDLWEWLHRRSREDPEGRSYRSGFWSTVPIPPQNAPGWLELEALVGTATGEEHIVPLARIEIVEPPVQSWPKGPLAPGTIAICMGTYEPDMELFVTQIESLRAQTDERWVCVVSDDGTADDRFAQMLDRIGEDPRFVVSRAESRVGPYLNFERALQMAPAGAELLAPCDQDDRWFPEKLETLRNALGSAQLVFSDYRLITADGGLIRDTIWQGRGNEYRNLASVVVANTIAGASMLFRRSVAELALPFPNAPGAWYHDHWLALVALSSGEVAYVDRPLYDYVQHAAAVSGHLTTSRYSAAIAGSRGLRSAYFGGYLPREVQARTLLLRCGSRLTRRKKRALEWFVAAERSAPACLWLAMRTLRELAGHKETLGGEFALVRGILWRWLLVVLVGRARQPGRRVFDASFPDPPRFEQPRLRRWRAGT